MEIAGYIGHENSGIVLYKNVWPKDSHFTERLESVLDGSDDPFFSWKQAMVGDSEIMKDYRDCVDFKVSQFMLPFEQEKYADIGKVYEEVIGGVRECILHYSSLYQLDLGYEEATNFVRYREGEHFSVHSDAGFSYSCTVSSIGYINDGYEGGEYMMPYQNIKFRPEKGDVIVHPSDFLYAHASLPVTKGTKYSAVTMYDYNDRNHQSHVGDPANQTQDRRSHIGAASTQVESLS
jgi:hypothetical protein